MAELSIKIPSINQSYYDKTSAKANQEKIVNVIRPKFGSIINTVSSMSNVPSQLIESFIFIESGGNEKAQSPYAVGLSLATATTSAATFIINPGFYYQIERYIKF
jgi:hypothetical protein